MPQNPFQSNVVEIRQEDLKENEFSQAGVQASETFRIDAPEGQILGTEGELTGFAKKEFGADRAAYQAVLGVLDDKATAKQVRELTEKASFLNPANVARADLQAGLAECQTALAELGERTDDNALDFDNQTLRRDALQQRFDQLTQEAGQAQAKLDNLFNGINEEGEQVEGLGEKASAIALIDKVRNLSLKVDYDKPDNQTRQGLEGYVAKWQESLDELGPRTEDNARDFDRFADNVANYQRQLDELTPIAVAAKAELENLYNGINDRGEQVEGLGDRVKSIAAAMAQQTADSKVAQASATLYQNAPTYQSELELGGDRQLLTRAVASTAVDRLLGTNVIAEEKFGVDETGKVVGVSIQAEGCGVKGDYRSPEDGIKRECVLATNYAEPAIQQGLAALEAVDYITGQVDRHCGNIFVDPANGKVTGIDNDLAFPECPREDISWNPEFKGTEGLPRVLDQATADKIMSVTPDQLRASLQGVQKPGAGETLGPREIEGAVQRLEQLQAAIRDPASVPRPAWEGKRNQLGPEDAAKLQNHPPFQVVPEFTPAHHAAALEYQDLRFKAAVGTSMSEAQSPSQLANFNRTSYAGSIEAQAKLIDHNMTHGQDHNFGVRPDNTINPIARNVEVAATQKLAAHQFEALEKQAKASILRNPGQVNDNALTNQITTLQAEITRLEDKLGEYEKRQSKPTLGDRFRGLVGGGTKNVLEGKADVAKTTLAAKRQELDQALETALQPHVAQMEATSRQAAQPRQPVERVGAALRQSQQHEHHHHNANSVGGSGEVDLSHENQNLPGPRQARPHPHR